MEKARIAEKGQILERDGNRYDVILADDDYFCLCRRVKVNGFECGRTDFRHPEIYTNIFDVNTLEDLKMVLC